jgi:hypothetical protein
MDWVQQVLDFLNRGGVVAALVLAIAFLLRERGELRQERDLWIDRAWRSTDMADRAVDLAQQTRRTP